MSRSFSNTTRSSSVDCSLMTAAKSPLLAAALPGAAASGAGSGLSGKIARFSARGSLSTRMPVLGLKAANFSSPRSSCQVSSPTPGVFRLAVSSGLAELGPGVGTGRRFLDDQAIDSARLQLRAQRVGGTLGRGRCAQAVDSAPAIAEVGLADDRLDRVQ